MACILIARPVITCIDVVHFSVHCYSINRKDLTSTGVARIGIANTEIASITVNRTCDAPSGAVCSHIGFLSVARVLVDSSCVLLCGSPQATSGTNLRLAQASFITALPTLILPKPLSRPPEFLDLMSLLNVLPASASLALASQAPLSFRYMHCTHNATVYVSNQFALARCRA